MLFEFSDSLFAVVAVGAGCCGENVDDDEPLLLLVLLMFEWSAWTRELSLLAVSKAEATFEIINVDKLFNLMLNSK